MNLKDLGYLDGEIKIYDAMLENLDEMIDDRLFKAELAAVLESIRLKCWLKLRELLEFVKSIPDAEVQEVVILRYRERHTWQHIAVRMDYGSEATWRVRCKRYLKKYIPAYLEKQGMM